MRTVFLVFSAAALLSSCAPLERPPTRETIELRGNPYERGLSHGQQLKSKINSFYTTLLTNSLFPYLSREQPDIATLMPRYASQEYEGGNFAYQLLLDSAKNVERRIPVSLRDEMRGVADGSGLSYEQVLLLNTFVDTTLSVRAVALAIRLGRAPRLTSVTFTGVGADGVDNDGDGQVDEPDEGSFSPYVPAHFANVVELPTDAVIRLVLTDADGVDPATVRLFLDNVLYTADNPAVATRALSETELEVTLTPPAPLPAASRVTLVVGAGDTVIIHDPPPSHASFMRDEELTFTTVGAGLAPEEVLRPELTDGRTRPAPVAFGVRRSLTDTGGLYLAQHFSLLDANTAHKHTVVLRHVAEDGRATVTVGWAGVVGGFSGMSDRGVGYVCNPSDTLDNGVVGTVLQNIADLSQAQLLADGLPVVLMGRRLLENATDVASAQGVLEQTPHVYGWTCLVGDGTGAMAGSEVDSDVFGEAGDGFFPVEVGGVNSTNGDNLIIGANYMTNVRDSPTLTLQGQRFTPQREWSGFFNRSRRVFDAAKERLDAAGGPIGLDFIEGLLGDPRFVDNSDSMNAVVLDFENLRVRTAMGEVPATAAPFEAVEVRP